MKFKVFYKIKEFDTFQINGLEQFSPNEDIQLIALHNDGISDKIRKIFFLSIEFLIFVNVFMATVHNMNVYVHNINISANYATNFLN